jgi:FkbM family methyltransferase
MKPHKRGLKAEEIWKLIGAHPDPEIVEIGCNDGADTEKWLEFWPGGRFFCFDPEPRALVKFQKRINDRRVNLYSCAVSDVDGFSTFYQTTGMPPHNGPGERWEGHDGDWDMSGSLCKPTGHLDYSPWTKFPAAAGEDVTNLVVPTVKLDTWATSYWVDPEMMPIINFMWCDPQGSQAKIIQGGPWVFSHTKLLYIEYYEKEMYEGEPDLEEILRLLGSDWELEALYGGDNALLRNKVLCQT